MISFIQRLRIHLICFAAAISVRLIAGDDLVRNDQIIWDADDIGLLAKVKEDSETSRAAIRLSTDQLIGLLMKDECWVAAHVILSQRHGLVKGRGLAIEGGHDHWNWLKVVLEPSGTSIDGNQKNIVLQFWKKKISAANQ